MAAKREPKGRGEAEILGWVGNFEASANLKKDNDGGQRSAVQRCVQCRVGPIWVGNQAKVGQWILKRKPVGRVKSKKSRGEKGRRELRSSRDQTGRDEIKSNRGWTPKSDNTVVDR